MSFSTFTASQRIWICTVKLQLAVDAKSHVVESTRSREGVAAGGVAGVGVAVVVRAVTRGSACVGGCSTEAVAGGGGATVVVVGAGVGVTVSAAGTGAAVSTTVPVSAGGA